jgi:hypothetical protein
VIVLASKYNSFMKKSIFLLIPLLIWGCEKTYDNLIDTSTENYQLSSVVGIKDTIDLKNPGDSLLALRLIFTPQSQVAKVYFEIYASDNSRLNSSPVEMQEVTENIFENQFILKRENPIGNYIVRFSASGNQGITKQIAVASFYFNNGQDNVPPVISNLVIPDSIAREIFFNFSVVVTDSNGLNDINEANGVFFNLYRPDGTLVEQSPFFMRDNGDPALGDEIAGDGIFSFRNSFAQTAQTGYWKFVFQAEDRSKTLSNIIEHLLLVK